MQADENNWENKITFYNLIILFSKIGIDQKFTKFYDLIKWILFKSYFIWHGDQLHKEIVVGKELMGMIWVCMIHL